MDLGIPYELWDKPSAEITQLKTQCDNMMEEYESEIEDWYNNYQEKSSLIEYLCKDRVLVKSKDYKCLYEKGEIADASSDASSAMNPQLTTTKDNLKTEL